jgi:hypothetical protein
MLFMDILSSEDFGVVTGMFGYDPEAMTVVEGFELAWGLPIEDRHASLDSIFSMYDSYSELGIDIEVELGIIVNSTVRGHQMLWQYYEVTDENGTYYHVAAVWNCDFTDRGFAVTYGWDYQDVFSLFHRFKDTIVCHAHIGPSEPN